MGLFSRRFRPMGVFFAGLGTDFRALGELERAVRH
jgi:hypothetical protein